MSPGRLAIGVDVGGTKIAAGLVDLEVGAILERREVPTPSRDGPAALAACARLAAELAPGGDTPVGIGLCELVSPDGVPRSAQTLDWRSLDVAGAFAGVGQVFVDSDVRTAGRAEALYGAGRGFSRLVFLNVGTGVSYCLLRDGVPEMGARGYAILVGAPVVEDLAGGAGLAAHAGVPSAREVLADPRHAALVGRAAEALGASLAALVNALDPDAVVIGGGLGRVGSYREEAVAAARPLIWADDARDLPILRVELDGDGPLLGAALATPTARS
jgi:glucokinase